MTPEEFALEFLGECRPEGEYGLCAAHDSLIHDASTCLQVLHLEILVQARDAEVRAAALREAGVFYR